MKYDDGTRERSATLADKDVNPLLGVPLLPGSGKYPWALVGPGVVPGVCWSAAYIA